MKTLFPLLLLLFFSAGILGQQIHEWPIDSNTKLYTISGVVTMDTSTTAQQLYSRARQAVAILYNGRTNDVTNLDPEANQIFVKSRMPAFIDRKKHMMGMTSHYGDITFTLLIQCKDGRYKYTITNFNHIAGADGLRTQSPALDLGPLENDEPIVRVFLIRKKQFDGIKDMAWEDTRDFLIELRKMMADPSLGNNDKW